MKNALSLVCMLLAGILMPTTSFAQSNTLFNPDYNGDGFIGVDDILGALSFYDTAWDGPVANVIYGCTYPLFVEYDASANVDDGSCLNLTPNCGSYVTYQGYDYATVLIGDQCWFAENLRSENYENGDAIPAGLSASEWTSTTSGATAVYGEGSSDCYSSGNACNEAWSLNEYGRLYNWYAVDDVRGLCPSGWHVPTDEEWMTMEMALGMSESEANSTGLRGTNQGTKMKTDYGWWGLNGTNTSGFSGLPGGYRRADFGNFSNAGSYGFWWSSSPNGSSAWGRSLDWNSEAVYRADFNPHFGLSVRCVWDAE